MGTVRIAPSIQIKKMMKMKLDQVQTYADVLYKVARRRINEDGWTFFVVYWEDDTFRLEYRHSCHGIVHRFLYEPMHDDSIIRHYIVKVDDLVTSSEGQLELNPHLGKVNWITINQSDLLKYGQP